MRNILLILCLFLSFTTKAQVVPGGIESKDLLRFGNYQSPTPAKFRLYPTSNRFTYLRLNTTNGFIDIVQYSTADDNRTIYPLSIYPLVATHSDFPIFSSYSSLDSNQYSCHNQGLGTP